jgi:hypothetical protein
MPARKYSSTAEAKTLSSAINNSVTSMTLNSVTTLPGTYPYTLVIGPDTAYEEIVTVTASGGGNVLTITRGQDGTSAQAHSAAVPVRHMITARDLQEPQDHINATSGVHAHLATLAAPTFTGTVVLPSTTSIGNVSSTEISYVDGVTSAIQTQFDTLTSNVALKAPLSPTTNAQTGTSYTLVLSDAGKYIEMNNASPNTVTVPATLTPDFPVGTEITIIQTGTGKTTIGFASGVVINYYSNTAAATSSIKAQWSAATLIKRATNTWVLIGNLT